jgi:hypothetical protein
VPSCDISISFEQASLGKHDFNMLCFGDCFQHALYF